MFSVIQSYPKEDNFTMETIALAGYLTTDIAYILDVCRFMTRSAFQMPKLGYFSCINDQKTCIKRKKIYIYKK